MRVLLSSVGRRGYLARYFKQALGNDGYVCGGDCCRYTSALFGCDDMVVLPKVTDPGYVECLLKLCKEKKIDLIVPLIDQELEILASSRPRFEDEGIHIAVSSVSTIEICFDKYLTREFAVNNSIPSPLTYIDIVEATSAIESGLIDWPLVVKPRKGSASVSIRYCNDNDQLQVAFNDCPSPMIQEYLDGQEYGYDIFGDSDGEIVSVYCKQKLSMRAGETDKAVSVSDPELIALGQKIAWALELYGPMDVDVIVTKDGPKLLEINPRFGGGYPCSHLCGADFPLKLIDMAKGKKIKSDIGNCPSGVYMFKQDEIVTCNQQQIDSIRTIRD